jgi:hypothetical protein
MSPVEFPGSAKGLIRCTEEHAEHNTEGLVKSGQWIVHRARVIDNSGGDPGVRELKQ